MENSNSNGFVKFITKAAKIIFINLLWLVCSLPIITVGASTCAAFYVMLKLVDNEEENIAKQFFKAFKDNFKHGTLMLLITVPTVAAAVFWWFYISQNDVKLLVKFAAFVYSIIVVLINLYAYPLIARYENSFKNTIKNSIAIAIQYLYSTAVVSVLVAVEIVVFVFCKETLIIGSFFIPGLIFFTISSFVKKTFLAIEQL